MKRFLLETLALWYWSIFSPYRLQAQVNRLLSGEEQKTLITDTNSSEILLSDSNGRFIIQCLLLLSIFTIPLIYLIDRSDNALHWLLVPGALFTACGIIRLSVAIGLHWPILVALTYWANPQIYSEVINETLKLQPSLSQPILLGFVASLIALAIISLLIYFLSDDYPVICFRVFVGAGTLSILIGSWITTQDWLQSFAIAFLARYILTDWYKFGFIYFSAATTFPVYMGMFMMQVFVYVMAGIVTIVVTKVLAGFVEGIVAGLIAVLVARSGVIVVVGLLLIFVGLIVGGVVEIIRSVVGIATAVFARKREWESVVMTFKMIVAYMLSVVMMVVIVVLAGSAAVLAVALAVALAVTVAGVVAGVVAGIATLQSPVFITAIGLIAYSISPIKKSWWSLGTAIALIAFLISKT